MPHFYFDVYDGDNLTRDSFGQHVESIRRASDIAVAALPDIAREVLPDGDTREMAVFVRFADGTPVLKAQLSLRVEWGHN